ncbi:MAG: hypothetical protein HY852_27540 [Bradyrhizobium sp.]|uniref:hypothetical protein n=1 Tax=Bradyrhizobium sp. TaxID=376 RepID=UPI0025C25181|nr:hypothetical protein [Bradyrhizobium sp.]MBI5265565.1 hypothetical protein [Bradyrhizobium sp.]
MPDLKFLIEQVASSIARLDQAIRSETVSENQDSSTAMILDDVTPGYRPASATLNACKAELESAMQSLRDAGVPEDGTEMELVLTL